MMLCYLWLATILAIVVSTTDAASTNPAFAYSAERESGSFCVASLIHSDVLLTAANCRGVFLKGAFVGGSNMDGSDGQYHEVEFEAVHPLFDAHTADHNVMLVKLATPSNAVVQRINAEDHLPMDGAELQVLGFNRESQTSEFPLEEMDITATKIDQEMCSEKYSKHGIYIAEDALFCSIAASTTCHGNLGSPVMDSRGNQVGLVAGGAECNSSVFPVLNVRTSFFGEFMLRGICTISSEPFDSCSGQIQQAFQAPPSAAPTPESFASESEGIDYVSAAIPIEFEEAAPTPVPSLRGSLTSLDEETIDEFDEESIDHYGETVTSTTEVGSEPIVEQIGASLDAEPSGQTEHIEEMTGDSGEYTIVHTDGDLSWDDDHSSGTGEESWDDDKSVTHYSEEYTIIDDDKDLSWDDDHSSVNDEESWVEDHGETEHSEKISGDSVEYTIVLNDEDHDGSPGSDEESWDEESVQTDYSAEMAGDSAEYTIIDDDHSWDDDQPSGSNEESWDEENDMNDDGKLEHTSTPQTSESVSVEVDDNTTYESNDDDDYWGDGDSWGDDDYWNDDGGAA